MANGGRSHRRWPADLEDQVFIKRPHAIEQFKERAKLPPSYNFDKAEADLRGAICAALRNGDLIRNTKNHGDPDNEFVVRVALSGYDVVYALVEKGASDGRYPFMCHTVFDQEMYHVWNEEGKIGTIGDLPHAKALKALEEQVKAQPKPKPMAAQIDPDAAAVVIFYKLGNAWCDKPTKEEELTQEVGKLLAEGVSLKDIRIFKEIPFKIEIKLE